MNFPYPCLCSSASLLKLSMNMHFSIKPCWVFLHIGSSKYFSRDIYGFLRRVCLLLLVSPKLFVGHAEHELPLSQSANMMMAAWMTSLQPEAFSTDFVVLLDVFLPHEHCNKQRTLSWRAGLQRKLMRIGLNQQFCGRILPDHYCLSLHGLCCFRAI